MNSFILCNMDVLSVLKTRRLISSARRVMFRPRGCIIVILALLLSRIASSMWHRLPFQRRLSWRSVRQGEKARPESAVCFAVCSCWLFLDAGSHQGLREAGAYSPYSLLLGLMERKLQTVRRHRLPLLDGRGPFGLCDSSEITTRYLFICLSVYLCS